MRSRDPKLALLSRNCRFRAEVQYQPSGGFVDGRYPFEQAFGMMGVDASLISLTDAIIDWCDQDDTGR